MLRNTIRGTSRINRFTPTMSVRFGSEGATGSGFSRAGGEAAGDSFTKREKAAEDLWVRQQETAKLVALKAKIKAAHNHLVELDKHIDELTKTQGGEKN